MSNNNQKPGLLIQLADALGEMLLIILMPVTFVVTWFAVFFWLLTFIGQDENPLATGSPFTLAQVISIFGAFGLAGGFAGGVVPEFLRRKMLLMGILYLMSALGFSLIGMMLPILTTSDENLTPDHIEHYSFLYGRNRFWRGQYYVCICQLQTDYR